MEIVEDISSLLVNEEEGLRSALRRLGEAGRGFLLAVDGCGRARGIMTDGDVRRFLLDGDGELDEAVVSDVMTLEFHSLTEDADQIEVEDAIDRFRFVPVMGSDGIPKSVVSLAYRRLPVMEPKLAGNEEAYLLECIRTGWISSQGRFVGEFESVFSERHNGRPCITTSSGTTALHLALEALGVGEGDEVIVPTLTFAATANAVIHARATPVLVDVDPVTWTIDPEAVAKAITTRTKAIIPVHLYGHPCRMDLLMEIAENHSLLVIEDCAESLGAFMDGRPVGTFGDAACFSFFGNKIITTGEGGMIAFKDAEHCARAAVLRDHGMNPERRYWHESVGYNYRMTNLQAALGLAQIEQLDDILEKRRNLALGYDREFSDLSGIVLPPRMEWADPVCWLYTILVDKKVTDTSTFMEQLGVAQIDTRSIFSPLHLMPAFSDAVCHPAPIAESVSSRGVSLPSSLALTPREFRRVVAAVRSLLGGSEKALAAC